jgi:hypothetical protein
LQAVEETECIVAKEPKAAAATPDTGAPGKPAAAARKKERQAGAPHHPHGGGTLPLFQQQ